MNEQSDDSKGRAVHQHLLSAEFLRDSFAKVRRQVWVETGVVVLVAGVIGWTIEPLLGATAAMFGCMLVNLLSQVRAETILRQSRDALEHERAKWNGEQLTLITRLLHQQIDLLQDRVPHD